MDDKINKKHYTFEEKEIIFKMHSQGFNCKEIGDKLGKTNKAINKFLHRNNLNTNQSILNKLTNEEIEDIVDMYLNGNTAKIILKKYRNKILCENTIISILRKNGVKIRDAKRFTFIKNEDFFNEINTEEKAYILGLIISDGYVVYPKRKGRTPFWGITLKSVDKYMLENIKKIIGVNKKISDNTNYHKYCKKNRDESIFIVTSSKMVTDLKKYGVVPKKTGTIDFPIIKENLYPHLIRGIFDGDGCISGQNCSFVGNSILIPFLQDFLHKELGIKKNKINITPSKTSKENDKYTFYFSSKKDVKNFYNYLYKDANIYLKRKKEKFQKLSFI